MTHLTTIAPADRRLFPLVLLMLLLLLGCPRPAARPPAAAWIPRHAPWQDGEVSYYAVMRGREITGLTMVRVRKTVQESRPCYELIVVNNAITEGIQTLHDSISALLTSDSLKPVSAFQIRALPARQETVISRYEHDQVILTTNHGRTVALPATANTFDNSILLSAIRTLALQPGARYLLTSVASFGPWTKPADITVTGEDTVTVPAGQFICNRVALQIAGHSLRLWYEKAAPHRYVRFEHPLAGSSAVLSKYEVLSNRR